MKIGEMVIAFSACLLLAALHCAAMPVFHDEAAVVPLSHDETAVILLSHDETVAGSWYGWTKIDKCSTTHRNRDCGACVVHKPGARLFGTTGCQFCYHTDGSTKCTRNGYLSSGCDKQETALTNADSCTHYEGVKAQNEKFEYFASLYRTQFRPPDWAKNYVPTWGTNLETQIWMNKELGITVTASGDSLYGLARIVATKETDVEVLQLLAKQREPTNLLNNAVRPNPYAEDSDQEPTQEYLLESHNFDQKLLSSRLGYSLSYYQTYWNLNKKLAPNFAVYTPAFYGDGSIVHVYNAIGYGFDHESQPDYQHFIGSNQFTTEQLAEEMTMLYKQLFANIFFFARKDNRFSTVVMSSVGGGNFAMKFKGDISKIWVKAFMSVNRKGITTKFIGKGEVGTVFKAGSIQDLLIKEFATTNEKFEYIGTFLNAVAGIDKAKSLIVNAWDPHSVPGNGNAGDISLDGEIGKATTIQFAGWGETNRQLLEDIVFCDKI